MEYSCQVCKKSFEGKQSGNRRFCSQQCCHLSQTKKVKSTCGICGKEFFYSRSSSYGQFCSKRCMYEWRRKRTYVGCKSCGKQFWAKTSAKRRYCSLECYHKFERGPNHRWWRGGRYTGDRHHYPRIYAPDHPRAQGRYVFEHILVMEKHLDRYLQRGEVIHHINGVYKDNKLANLLLLENQGEHAKIHRREDRR